MKKAILFLLGAVSLCAQTVTRWSATTGLVSQTGSTYTATLQQPASNQAQVAIDKIIVYCSAACVVTQSAYGSPATTTLATIQPLLPSPANTPISLNFFIASNVGPGTQQGGPFSMLAGQTQPFCLSTTCGEAGQIQLPTTGTAANYSVSISAITGTSSITFYGRSGQ